MSKKNPNIKDRVLQIADFKEVSKQEFFRNVGLNYSNFTGKSRESDLNSTSVAEILLKYPDVNPIWLLIGEGPMLREIINISQKSDGDYNNNIIGNDNMAGQSNEKNRTNINDCDEIIKEKNRIIDEKDKVIQRLLDQQEKLINKL